MSFPATVGEPTGLRDLLHLQHAIATREQFVAAGLSEAEILVNLDGRRWQRLNDHVVATHNGPLTRRQEMWAVVLSAPGLVALCAETVYELFGVPGAESDAVHVLIPRGG